jgi:hypothetical protein
VPREPTPLYLVFDGLALESLLHRIVWRCPPTLEDFCSYEVLGRPYNRRDFFRGIGVSMHVTRKRAIAIARHFDVGRGVAEVDLRGLPVAWARTGGRDHVTVWAPPELLLRAVVQCDEHE